MYLWERFNIKPEEAEHVYPEWQIALLLAGRDAALRASSDAPDLSQSPYDSAAVEDYTYL